jgi:predicted AAA+ superfamily ATPase
MSRYLKKQVLADLKKKMVFLGGPRQVGKTTLSLGLLAHKSYYFNWDTADHRQKILKHEYPAAPGILVFDELHKYKSWRNYLKGVWDDKKGYYQILVTGSARLDLFRRGGDSLQGRYHYLRLHPLSLAEIKGSQKDLELLMKYGGFPEPFFGQDEVDARRWSLDYRERLIKDEVSSLEGIQDLGNLELLMMRLPELVGSPLSINSLREDLQLNHKTVSRWLEALERLYALFRLSPFGAPKIKAVKKEQKHYHFDWTLVPIEGLRFENMMACHLLKWVHYHRDTQGLDCELRYFRDVYKREVDFVILENRKPTYFIECRLDDDAINPGLIYLQQRFPHVESFQLSLKGKKDYRSKDGIRVCPAAVFLKDLV